MGVKIGHEPFKGAGRPKGSKDSYQRQRMPTHNAQREIRNALTEAYKKNEPEILVRVFKELNTLEGYGYISGLNIILKNILPSLQSVTIEDTSQQTSSPLMDRIAALAVITETIKND